MTTNSTTTVDQLRRRAARHGFRIWQPRGQRAWEYGPVALIDIDSKSIGPRGLTVEDAVDLLDRWDNEPV